MSKDAYYFPHDSNAQHDEKILKLRVKYNWAGYGLYWAIVEKLREATNYRLDSNDIACLSLGVSHPIDDLIAFLNDCYKWKLLSKDNGWFWSESLCNRMEEIDKRRQQLSDAGKRGNMVRWKGNRKAIAKQSQGNRSKVKESKVKESKEEDTTTSTFVDLWNNNLPIFKITKLSSKRTDHLQARLKEDTFKSNFTIIIEKIIASDFLMGRKPSATHPNFKAGFDWIISNDNNYLKVLEGKYDNPAKPPRNL